MNVSKRLIEQYVLRGDRGAADYADISIGPSAEGWYRLSISSDYGNWGNSWPIRELEDFKKFIVDLDLQYFAGKVGAEDHFDLEGTISELEAMVQHFRTEWSENEEGVDWDIINKELHDVKMAANRADYESVVQYICIELKKIIPLECFPFRETINPGLRAFWEKIWPHFVSELKQELKQQ